MRFSDIIVVVRKPTDVPLIMEAGAAAGWRKIIPHVVGAPGAPTANQLRRVRRSPDVRKRRLPMLVWTQTSDEENAWREAGAYVARGRVSKVLAEKILREIAAAHVEDWVESTVYVGPDRRRKRNWLSRPARPRRLADEAVVEKQNHAVVDQSSFATHMRQLRHTAFGCGHADRGQRAQILADVYRTRKAAERSQVAHAVAAMDSLARYLTAAGSTGKLIEELVERHLDIAEGAPVDASGAMPRVVHAVDAAIGLNTAA